MSYTQKLQGDSFTEVKKKFADINKVMLTHLEGECPLFIFEKRRPLESTSNEGYALDYRKENYHPVTKSPFDKAISAVSEISMSANIAVTGILEDTKNTEKTVYYCDEEIDLYEFCLGRATRIRELDVNGVVVVWQKPEVEPHFTTNLDADFSYELTTQFIKSEDIFSYKKGVLVANLGKWEYKEGEFADYKLIISTNQTALSIPIASSNSYEYKDYPIYANNLSTSPIISISKNTYNKKGMKYNLPYFWGAAAWGNKYVGEMTDFDIKMARFTYPFTVKAIMDCQEPGKEFRNGKHWDIINNCVCNRCQGVGKIYPEESPLGAIHVDYSKFNNGDGINFPIISFIEPGQAGITTSKDILADYWDKMLAELGLMKQNMTAQSGERASYDEKTRISMYTNIVVDNVRLLEAILNVIQDYLHNFKINEISTITVEIIGELNILSNEERIAELSNLKTSNAPPSLVVSNIKKILLKQLGDNEINRRVVDLASVYDRLFIYGYNDLATVRAQLGSYITEKYVIIHNTLIEQILTFLKENPDLSNEQLIEKLNTFYAQFDTVTKTNEAPIPL